MAVSTLRIGKDATSRTSAEAMSVPSMNDGLDDGTGPTFTNEQAIAIAVTFVVVLLCCAGGFFFFWGRRRAHKIREMTRSNQQRAREQRVLRNANIASTMLSVVSDMPSAPSQVPLSHLTFTLTP